MSSVISFADPGDLFGGQASADAAQLQEDAAYQNYILQKGVFDKLWADQGPMRETRDTALGAIDDINNGGSVPFGPGYQAQKRNLLDSNARGYAARGKLLSGERLTADQQGVSRLASNETQKGTNRLLNLAGFSTQDMTNQNQLLQRNINSQSTALNDIGAARASGLMGEQNAMNDLFGTAAAAGGYAYGRWGQ